MKLIPTTLLALTGFLTLSACASADIVTWTLQNVNMDIFGGGVLSGSFVYDANTNTYSDISIASTRTSGIFDVLDFGNATQLSAFQSTGDLTGTDVIGISLGLSSLTDAGGTVPLDVYFEATCLNSTCSSTVTDAVGERAASLVAEITPEPSYLFLGSAGVVAFCALAIRRRRAA